MIKNVSGKVGPSRGSGLSKRVKGFSFPLVTFRSKSGGAHLFLFAKEFIPASLMQSKLKAMADALGYAGSEIFPKQTEI